MSIKNGNKLNCWQALKCNQTECPAYGVGDHNCWLISGTLCHDNIQGECLNKIELCLNCKVFNRNMTISSAKKTFQILSPQLIEYKKKIVTINKENQIKADQIKLTNQVLDNIIEFLPDPTFAIDKDKKVIEWNKAIEDLTGVKRAEIIGKGDYAYAIPFYGYKRPILIDLLDVPDEDIEKIYTTIKRKSNTIFGEIYISSLRDGKGAYLWAIAAQLFDKHGNRIGAIESIRDITEYKENEQMVIDANENLRIWANDLEQRTRELGVLNEMGEQLQSCINIEEAYAVISQTMQRLSPTFSGCLYILNKPMNQLDKVSTWGEALKSKETFKHSECRALRMDRIHTSETGKKGYHCRHLLKGFSGNYICVRLIAQGEIIGLLHLQAEKEQSALFDMRMAESIQQLIITISEHISLSLYNIQLRETLSYQAIRDPLTGLFNRRYMEETLERELQRSRRKNSTLGLIMFDIDHFKRFNDTFGHAAGDTMLREIALFVKLNVRMEDIVSRYGGEEFLITMPDASIEITRERAETLRQEVKKIAVVHRRQPLGSVTLSFGVSVFPTHGQKGEVLIKAADKALYKAKAGGRDKVVVAE